MAINDGGGMSKLHLIINSVETYIFPINFILFDSYQRY